MAPSLGGHKMLGLYGEGISKMPENPGIPPLFRDIFKNAYLPYRNPETLKAFLKIIDEFTTPPAAPPASSSPPTSTSSAPTLTPRATAGSPPTKKAASPKTSRATTSLPTWCASAW